ncbi:chorismate-binding protein [Flavobacterium turcicum]|uniref:Chorismate-binding protein n=1 Tax=Flavobacterium turcicum TaxID=2764718 RepID=A0ABR7JGA1_9FLAO|nr:chorismate-binding protein [Flavobacterium turcicum]MBC5863393.1 chorismate-binding protein [Flavobacterium turcicum]NHL02125.1 isochorismate synthase [Flavobacterium turcicum]
MENLLRRALEQRQANLPFVLYHKPQSDEVIGFFQKDDHLYQVADFTENGFVFASFDGSKKHLIPEEAAEVLTIPFVPKTILSDGSHFSNASKQDQEFFQNLVQKAVVKIQQGALEKVVLSRVETITINDFDLFEVFEKLVNLYPATCVYCFYHPQVGLWMGATPEQLLQIRGTTFETISLAGTQKATSIEVVNWGLKEQEEQQFVTDFLLSKLKPVTEKLNVTPPFSIQAGAIWHIKTVVSGQLGATTKIRDLVNLLHPTPAVCGLPTTAAKQFILENENYDRQFYTGFLGELNVTFGEERKDSDLFVNLRCMQIDIQQDVQQNTSDVKVQLYMGCGVTKDSIPAKEWEESVNKSSTMKKVFS